MSRPTTPVAAEDLNRAQALAEQLHALLVATYGLGGEGFRSLGHDLQDSYLWACADLADALRQALQRGTEGGAA